MLGIYRGKSAVGRKSGLLFCKRALYLYIRKELLILPNKIKITTG